jgi:hypothetical protein
MLLNPLGPDFVREPKMFPLRCGASELARRYSAWLLASAGFVSAFAS